MATRAVLAYRLAGRGGIPNHPRWPLLLYPGAVEIQGPDPARAFEVLFERNGWPPAWRNGVYPFHHFHSNAHEVLGVYSGEVTVRFGGDGGVDLVAKPGDVVVLPAGTGHKKRSARGALGVVGAYPAGQRPDTCTPSDARSGSGAQAVLQVPLPSGDPVFGPGGPLFEHWRD